MAEPEGYIVSRSDAEVLKQIIANFKNTTANPRNRPHFDSESEVPDLYVARSPNSGIPALTRAADAAHHDIPGSALCNIYHLTTVGGVTAIYSIPNFQKRVWNISEFAYGGNKWVVVNKTSAGYWLAQSLSTTTIIGETGTGGTPLPPGTGLSPASPCATDLGFGWVAGLIKNLDCLKLEVIASSGICTSVAVGQVLRMRWDGSRSKWVTRKWRDSSNDWVDDLLLYGGGVGTGPGEASPVVFWIDQGRPRLQIENISYDLVGPVCSSAGYATFVGGTQVPCHTHPSIITACDNTFTIRISCDCCSIRGWEGPGWYCVVDVPHPGTASCPTKQAVVYLTDPDRCDIFIGICSGPYATEGAATTACIGEVVTSPCCPGVDIPTTLYAHFSGGTGVAACINGTTITLKYSASTFSVGLPGWQFDFIPPNNTGVPPGACALLNIPGCGGRLQNWFAFYCTALVQWEFQTGDSDPTCTGDTSTFGSINVTPPNLLVCEPFSASYFGVVISGADTVNIVVNTIP